MKGDLFTVIAEDYQHGKLDHDLDTVFACAAQSGIVLLPGDAREYTEAKGGAYDLADLLLPADLDTWKTLTAAHGAGINIFPVWTQYNSEKHYFEFTQEDLCREFIKAHKLTRQAGTFLASGEPISDDEVRDALRRTLAIVRKDAGKDVYGTFAALRTICKNSDPNTTTRRDWLTLDAVKSEMQNICQGMRYNVISGEFEISGRTDAGRVMSQEDLVVRLHDALVNTHKGVSFSTLERYTSYIARENEYNPVLDLLATVKWDGTDRLPQLYALIGVEHDELSKTLIRKWLYQTVALLFNDIADPFGADGCLVLNGGQGVGKTRLFRHLAMCKAWFGEGGIIDDWDKDTERRVVTRWITELGEVESTLKSDISKLKAFITASVDRYRLPYGRTDVVAPRRTSLSATCNSERYLIDPTGNRRWWSVPFARRVTDEEQKELDAQQLWGQIYAIVAPLTYDEKKACFRLTSQELSELENRNGAYEKPLKGQLEVEDIIAKAQMENLTWRDMTVSEWKGMWDVLRPYSVQVISAALKKCGITPEHTRIGSTANLPTPSKGGYPL